MNPIRTFARSAAALLGAAALLTGCETTQPKAAVMPPTVPERVTAIEPVRFSPEGWLGREVRVRDDNDPQQLINFALSLSARGRHAQAAEFFREAAAKFRSEGNDLAVSCRAASANEFLIAGDMKSFREAVQELKKEMDRFQTAAVDPQTATILALGELALGVNKPSATTPAALWELYHAQGGATAAATADR